jgi:anti-sigma B factor antagonist
MILDIDDREENGVTVVEIEGKMTTTTSPDADVYFKELLADGVKQMLLNLEGVDFIASTGLRVILAAGKKLMATEGRLALCNLNPTVADVFRLSGFSQMFDVFNTEEEALASF